MKRMLILLTAVCLLSSACGSKPATLEAPEAESTPAPEQSVSGLDIDMSKYSDQARLLTPDTDNMYLQSYHCGYLSDFEGDASFIIRSQAELDAFNAQYPEANQHVPVWYPDTGEDYYIEYDLEHYDLLLDYFAVGSPNYRYTAGGLLVDTDILSFVMTSDSGNIGGGEEVAAVMDGFWFEAAVPKGTLLSDSYYGWTYLDAEEALSDPPMPVDTPASADAPAEDAAPTQELTNPGMPVDENGSPEMENPAMPTDNAE